MKNTVYEDTLLITLWNEGQLNRDDLVNAAIDLLGCEKSKDHHITRRIDSLLSKGKLVSLRDKSLSLAPDTKTELENAERIYLQEFKALGSDQTALMKSKHGISWSLEDSQKACVLLAKVFIKRQLESANSAKLRMTAMGLLKDLNHSLDELKDFILDSGVPKGKVDETIRDMLIQAEDLPIVKKLSRAAIFVALEGVDAISGAKAIGAARWSDVYVMLDASVAIPYLCAKLFQPTKGRFSSSNHATIETLHKLSANICIPFFYINECASHLLRARNYDSLDEYGDKLEYSQNRFVAHYYQLKNLGQDVPSTLLGYLSSFSSSCKQAVPLDPDVWIRKVMTDLQPLFHGYDVEYEKFPNIPRHHRRDIEIEYSYYLEQLRRRKNPQLIEHDILAMAHIRRQKAEKYESWVLLTWDRAMISVGKKLEDCGWIISPDILYEFAKQYRPISESQLCTLAHAIARTHDVPHAISAQIIDRIVYVAGDKMQDWELKEKINEFANDLL